MRALVTGGAGFIGSNLVKRLIEYGVEDILVIDPNIEEVKESLSRVESRILLASEMKSIIILIKEISF